MENLDESRIDQDNKEEISLKTINYFKRSSGWMKSIAILGIIFSAIGVVAGVVSLFANTAFGLINLIFYGFFVYLSLLLLRAANSVEDPAFDLEQFAENHYKYWKFIVIYIIVAVVFTLLFSIYIFSVGVNIFNGFGF